MSEASGRATAHILAQRFSRFAISDPNSLRLSASITKTHVDLSIVAKRSDEESAIARMLWWGVSERGQTCALELDGVSAFSQSQAPTNTASMYISVPKGRIPNVLAELGVPVSALTGNDPITVLMDTFKDRIVRWQTVPIGHAVRESTPL